MVVLLLLLLLLLRVRVLRVAVLLDVMIGGLRLANYEPIDLLLLAIAVCDHLLNARLIIRLQVVLVVVLLKLRQCLLLLLLLVFSFYNHIVTIII